MRSGEKLKLFSDSLSQGDMWRHGSGNVRSTVEEWQVRPGLHTNPDLSFEILSFPLVASPFKVFLLGTDEMNLLRCKLTTLRGRQPVDLVSRVLLLHSWSSRWWEPVGKTLISPSTTFSFPLTLVQIEVGVTRLSKNTAHWIVSSVDFSVFAFVDVLMLTELGKYV